MKYWVLIIGVPVCFVFGLYLRDIVMYASGADIYDYMDMGFRHILNWISHANHST